MNTYNFSINLGPMADLAKSDFVMSNFDVSDSVMFDCAVSDFVMCDYAVSDFIMCDFVKPDCARSDLVKPESGRFLLGGCVEDLRPPSGVSWCTSERAERRRAAYANDTPALRFRATSLATIYCDVSLGMLLPAKPVCARSDLVKPVCARSDLVKPESGRLLFWGCVEDLRPPSGVCWCTSERTESKCDAYAIDTSALRFLSFGLRI